jgi:hypothetical protein
LSSIAESAAVPDERNRLEVVLLDYEMARDDERSSYTIQATILSVAVALLAGLAAIVSQACAYDIASDDDCARVPDALLAAIPLAPLAMVAFLQMVGTAGTIRNYYLRALEHELREHVPAEFSRLGGLRPSTYVELLTGQVSTTRGSVSYRFISFFIIGALLLLFGGLTIFMATGLAPGWAAAMLIVYGTAAAFIAAEAIAATVKGRSLFSRLAAEVPSQPELPQPHKAAGFLPGSRSLLSCVLIPRARADEAVKRVYMPLAFLLAVAAQGNWSTVDWGRFLLVWFTFEFLLYDARYQWNDIRNYREDRRLGRTDRLPHSALDERSDAWKLHAGRVVRSAVLAVWARIIVAVALCLLFVDRGIWGDGPLWAAGLAATVLVTAVIYEALRARGAVWPIWIWVGVGYGARATIGVVLAGFGLLSAQAVLTPIAVTALGVAVVTLTWTLQTFGHCTGSRTHAVVHGETRPHLLGLLPLAGVRVSETDGREPAGDAVGRTWHIDRDLRDGGIAPWEPAVIVSAGAGAAFGVLLADPGTALLVLMGTALISAAAAALLLLDRRPFWPIGAVVAAIAPVVVCLADDPEAADLIAAVPTLLLVALYCGTRTITLDQLVPDFRAAAKALFLGAVSVFAGSNTTTYVLGETETRRSSSSGATRGQP